MTKEDILRKYYGYNEFKKEQLEIIDSLLNHKDCIGILPTGYGKSITFQVSALLLEGITLVVTPLISLMQDQVLKLKKKKYPAEFISSLQNTEEQDSIYRNLKRIKLLYLSGERLQSKRFLQEIKKYKIGLFVCDEAHTLLWGEDFRDALIQLPAFINTLGYRPPHLALTATATSETLNKIVKYLELEHPKIVVGNCDRKNIFYKIIHTNDKRKALLTYLVKHNGELGLIYCLTIRACEEVYKLLKSKGFSVGVYHGALSSEEKMKIQKEFSNGQIKIMICTNAFGMGIDIQNIRYVIVYSLPSSIEDFVQQIGRASRDNQYAEAILFFNPKDIQSVSYFIEHIQNKKLSDSSLRIVQKERYRQLDHMVQLCLTKGCLHQYVCQYFGQRHSGKCNMCSNCKKTKIIDL